MVTYSGPEGKCVPHPACAGHRTGADRPRRGARSTRRFSLSSADPRRSSRCCCSRSTSGPKACVPGWSPRTDSVLGTRAISRTRPVSPSPSGPSRIPTTGGERHRRRRACLPVPSAGASPRRCGGHRPGCVCLHARGSRCAGPPASAGDPVDGCARHRPRPQAIERTGDPVLRVRRRPGIRRVDAAPPAVAQASTSRRSSPPHAGSSKPSIGSPTNSPANGRSRCVSCTDLWHYVPSLAGGRRSLLSAIGLEQAQASGRNGSWQSGSVPAR